MTKSHAEMEAERRAGAKLHIVTTKAEDNAGGNEQDDPEIVATYRAMRVTRSKAVKRVWLHPAGDEPGYQLQYFQIGPVKTDLKRRSDKIPQRIILHAYGQEYIIRGFHLEDLARRLHDEHVEEVWAYSEAIWPDSKPLKGNPIVTAIIEIEPEGDQHEEDEEPPRKRHRREAGEQAASLTTQPQPS